MSESGKVLEQLYLHMKKIVTVQNQFMTACLGFTETFDDDNDANDNNSTDKSKAQGKGKKGDREGDDNGYVSSDDDMADPSSRGRWKHGSALKEVLGGTPSKHSHSTVSVMTSPPPTRGLQSAQSSATLPSSPLSTSVTFHNKIDYFAKASASAVSSPTLGALNAYNNVDNHTLDIVALSEDKRSLRKQKRKQQREDRYDQVFQETIMKIMDLNTLKVEELRASRLKMDENFHTHQYSKRYVRKTQELQKKITAAKLALDPKLQTKYALQEQELQERIYAQPGDDYNKKIQQKKQDREKNMTRRQKKANLLLHLEAAFDKYFGRYAQALERNRTMSALCLTSKSVIKSLEDRGSVNQKMFSTMLQDTESKLEVELSYKKRIEDDLGDMAHKHKHAMIRVYELEKELEMVKYSTKQLGRTYSGGVAWKQPTREAAVQCDMLKDGSGAAQMLR